MSPEQWSVSDARSRLLNVAFATSSNSVNEAVRRMGFVQEDSIDVCGRMHDLILRNRVDGYHPKQLESALYGGDAALFEDYLPNLCAVGREHLCWFAPRMHGRRANNAMGAPAPDEQRCLDTIRERGPMRARDFDDDLRRSHSGWGTRRTVTTEILERLWRQGRIAIASRISFHRVFDLPERVYGAEASWLSDDATVPDPQESELALQRLALRSRPIVRATRSNQAALRDANYAPIRIGEDTRVWWVSPEIRDWNASENEALARTRLIAPLDPVVYDRKLTLLLFQFDYRWEVYTPAASRRRGYYVLPILQNGAIVGWVDLQINRSRNLLVVHAGCLSPVADAPAVDDALAEFATERQTVFARDFRWLRSDDL